MADGYTRQRSSEIVNGNVIDADDFDVEFNAVAGAMNASTGHNHDGTSGGGAPIESIGPAKDLVVTSTNVNPSTTNTLSLGAAGAQYKDAFFDGTVQTDLLLVDETSIFTGAITANGGITGNLTGDVTGDLTGNADTATTWATAREIALTGDVTGSVTGVDGSGNISITTTVAANSVALGTDTSGNYMTDVSAGTGVTVTHTPNEGSTATVAIGQAVGTTDNVTFNAVTANLTGNVTGNVTVNVTGNADTATTLATARTIAGQSFNGSADITIAATDLSDTNQALSTTSDVTFNDLTVSGNLTVSGTTTTVNTETINLADNQIVLNSNETGAPTQNGGIEIERGTETNKTLLWYENVDEWSVGSETFEAGTFKGDLTKASDLTISATGTGDITLDAAGDIILDADANAQVIFKDNGVSKFLFDGNSGSIQTYTGDLQIRTTTSGAILIQSTGSGNDVTLKSSNDAILDPGTGVTKLYRGGTQLAQLDTGSTYGDPLKISTSATATGTMTESLWVDQYGVNVLYGLRVGDSSNPTEDDIYAVGDIEAGGNMTCTTSNVTTIDFGDWTITESAGVLYFATGGTNKMKLDASGNLTVTGNVTAYGTV